MPRPPHATRLRSGSEDRRAARPPTVLLRRRHRRPSGGRSFRLGQPSEGPEENPSPQGCIATTYALVISEIGTLNEGTLHASLKRHYAAPGDAFEVPLEGFIVDLVKEPGTVNELLVEIQTGSFGAMGNKLDRLLSEHKMLLVHPIAVRTRLERADRTSRRSPKRGSIYSIFDELVSIPTLLDHPNLELDVVLFEETRKQVHDPSLRRRRGGWRTVDRHVDEILDVQRFRSVEDLGRLLPSTIPHRFTTADIVAELGCSRDAAQKLAYCFRAASLIELVDRTRAGHVYELRASRGS